jgi:hypothetical protein
MSFALWWALSTIPGGLWPALGLSWSDSKHSLWFQSSPTRFGGRPQLAARRGDWSLVYGSQMAGWGWSLTRRGTGIWHAQNGGVGAMWSGEGQLASKPWSAKATWQRHGWVGSASWNGINLQRTLGGTQSLTWRTGNQWIEANQNGSNRSLGYHDQSVDARWLWGPELRGHVLRLHAQESSLEWRRTQTPHSIQQQLTWTLNVRDHRMWVHLSERNGSPQLNVRAWIQTPDAGGWMAGWSTGQATLRWSAPRQSPFSGSYVELGNPHRACLSYRSMRFFGEWSAQSHVFAAGISARHGFRPKEPRPADREAASAPAWIDLNVEMTGSPPALYLEFCGTRTYRVQVLPQERQWKDHVPPGTYAVRGSAPTGWDWKLPTDSVRLESGKISQVWVRLERPKGYIRWINAPGGAAGSSSP